MQQEQIKYQQRQQMFSSTVSYAAVSNSSSSSSLNSNSSSSISSASAASQKQHANDALVASLRKSLNDVVNQKELVRKQIEDISKQVN